MVGEQTINKVMVLVDPRLLDEMTKDKVWKLRLEMSKTPQDALFIVKEYCKQKVEKLEKEAKKIVADNSA